MDLNADGLLHLLKAGSPDFVDSVLVDTFRYRRDGLPATKRAAWQQTLGISPEHVEELARALQQLVKKVVYEAQEMKDIPAVFPSGFHENLKKLMSKKIASHHAEWRAGCARSLVSPPTLVDFDWRVDTKTSSNHLSRMAVPTVLVEMKLQQPPAQAGLMAGTRQVQFELTKETLATMLDGLGKIRDQLSTMKDPQA